jgi:hypothetical protein
VPTEASALGVIRAGVHGVFLLSILLTSFTTLGQLPLTIMRPAGAMGFLSWDFYERLVTPGAMATLKGLMLLSLLASTAGYLTSVSTRTSALLVLFYQGLLRSFGHFNHDELIAVYFLVVLAFTPCGEGFAVDSLPGTKRRRPHAFAYGYPILLMQILLAWTYFSSALLKLRVRGLDYLSGETLPVLAITHSLDNLHDTQFRLAFWLPQMRPVLPLALALVMLWELLFPLAVCWKRARRWLLGAGVLFHLSTLFLMNIFFPYQLAMYLVFVNWPRVNARLARTRLLKPVVARWRRFRGEPEVLQAVRLPGEDMRETLLWDEGCGACARLFGLLRRIARKPLDGRPLRAAQSSLPPEARVEAGHEMLWIDSHGRMARGSQALIEALSFSGRTHLAALLESGCCRPLTWLGFRFYVRRVHEKDEKRL